MQHDRTTKSRPQPAVPADLPADPGQTHRPHASVTMVVAVAAPCDPTDPASLAPPTSDSDPSSLLAPAPRHHYRLEHLIAIGGQGEVWEATQLSLDRPVAVKQLRDPQVEAKVGTTDDHFLAEHQFRQEALLTASLEHPNIVPVHDYSLTPGGRAQLSMKLIRGSVWHELILREHAEFGPAYLQRHLEILVAVTQAVAFAHSRGIMHRDIKPGQVVVGEFGEVMLLDWGIALRFARPDGEHDGRSASFIQGYAANPAGTPSFMAPEQTSESTDLLGPWSDVYLLGGTLHFLLTASPPHKCETSEESFKAASKGVVMPVRERAPHLAIPEDLARLCDQALQADIRQRVPSAQAFLQGLRDHLSGASRQRASVAVTEQLAPQVAASGDVGYDRLGEWQAALAKARGEWPDNPQLGPIGDQVQSLYAAEALAKGDIALAIAQAEHIDDADRRRELLDRARSEGERRRRLAHQRRVAIAAVWVLLLAMIGGVAWHLSDVRRRNAELQAAVVKADAASARARDSQAQSEMLVAFLLDDLRTELEPIGRLKPLHDIGNEVLAYFDSRRAEERTPEMKLRHASALRWKAAILVREGDLKGAAELGLRAVDMLGEVEAGHASLPDVVIESTRALLGLATAARRTGDLDAAEGYVRQAREAHERLGPIERPPAELRRMFIDIVNDQAAIRSVRGDYAGALPIFIEGRDSALRLLAEDEPTTPTRMLVARCHTNVGRTMQFMDDFAGALESFGRAEAMWRDLIAADPENGNRRHYLAALLANKGIVQRRSGLLDEAERTLTERLAIMRSLAEQDPLNLDWQRGLSLAHGGVATVQQVRARLPEAIDNYARNLAILQTLLASMPDNADWRIGQARTHLEIASALRQAGRIDDAARHIDDSLVAVDRGIAASPNFPDWQEVRANALVARAALNLSLGRHDLVVADTAEVRVTLDRPQAATLPAVLVGRLRAMADALAARAAIRAGDADKARRLLASARRVLADAKVDLGSTYENRLFDAQVSLAEAEVEHAANNHAACEELCRRAVDRLEGQAEAATEPRGCIVRYEAAVGLGDAATMQKLDAWFAESGIADPEIAVARRRLAHEASTKP